MLQQTVRPGGTVRGVGVGWCFSGHWSSMQVPRLSTCLLGWGRGHALAHRRGSDCAAAQRGLVPSLLPLQSQEVTGLRDGWVQVLTPPRPLQRGVRCISASLCSSVSSSVSAPPVVRVPGVIQVKRRLPKITVIFPGELPTSRCWEAQQPRLKGSILTGLLLVGSQENGHTVPIGAAQQGPKP